MARITSAVLTSQVMRFGVVGLLNTALSYCVYSIGIYAGLAYYVASLLALLFGIVAGFFMQGRLVFRAQLKGRFPYFVAMWALLYLVNIGIIYVLVAAGLDYYTAGLVAAIPVVAVSFILQKLFIFKG